MCHVLVIEDEFFIADYIVQLIEGAGATSISQAVSEEGAIDEARRRRPSLIMSDVKLIEGTGPQAVRTILAELGAIPVIFVTGTPEDCGPNDAGRRPGQADRRGADPAPLPGACSSVTSPR